MRTCELGTRETITTSVAKISVELHSKSLLLRRTDDGKRETTFSLSWAEFDELVRQAMVERGIK